LSAISLTGIVDGLRRISSTVSRLARIDRQLDHISVNQGCLLAELNRAKSSTRLADYEFKVFSQWGEDGIIQFLVANLAISKRTFIEFGVEDFSEANCRFLMMKDRWSGFVIDGSAKNINRLRSSHDYWRHSLQARAAFVTRENIGEILEQSGFAKDVGILSLDIDGVDYHVLSALASWRPSILIVEYNAVFGQRRAVSVPYDPGFQRASKHRSNLYYGASLPAFHALLSGRAYALVGVNTAGSNAFFVRKDLLNDVVTEVSVAECFRDSDFREGRDADGQLTFATGNARRVPIADLPLIDVLTGVMLRINDLETDRFDAPSAAPGSSAT